ncbi:adhesion G protein-coupled receptor F5 isoform X2 [Coregonus clupeaformis]|uniref:adhesion G protein-coupled receptor F5 isoform X2 n=1 Tax=Coregonus clupeaformis TaxID=59861 RepID=UPI001E1C32ED|nr:adhesion G protein-coupled receptor F5 isoform X2 [Coregonus clupeaformis]
MASPKTVWYLSILLVFCCSLEKQDCLETPNVTSEESPTDGSQVPSREKREVTANLSEKILISPISSVLTITEINITTAILSEKIGEVELDITNIPAELIDVLKASVKYLTYPILISSVLNITEINITTACYQNSIGFQCRCEDQYGWSCDQCSSYGSCDDIIDGKICGCVNAVPSNGQFCQPITNLTACPSPTTPAVPSNISGRIIEIELDMTNISVTLVDVLKASVNGLTYPILISNVLNVTDVNFTTACYPNSTCRCEDQYGWSCDQCLSYGSCDSIADDSCGCIKAIPPDGPFCQPIPDLTACPTPSPIPAILSEKIGEVELDITNIPAELIDVLKASVKYLTYPILISSVLNITEINITTACYQNSIGFQCRCEDQYGWSCDQCSSYGSCDDIIDGKICGCVNAVPSNGPFCQPIPDLTACPTQSPIPVSTTKQTTASSTTPTTPSSTTSIPTTKQSTASSTTPTTPSVNTLNLQFTMDITFNSTFNDENNAMFKDVDQTIRDVYKRNMRGFISAKLNRFKSGSVISDFTVMTTIVDNEEIAKAKDDIVSTIGGKYKIRFTCLNNTIFGNGQVNEIVVANCKSDEVGYKTAICQENGTFSVRENNCVLKEIENLFLLSQTLVGTDLPGFLERLRNSTFNLLDRIVASPATISIIVDILKNVANVSRSTPINKPLMTNFLETAGVLTSNGAKASWDVLNTNLTKNENSVFLGTFETISNFLTNDFFDIETPSIILNKTSVNNSVNNSFNLNSSVLIDIPASEASFNSITIITFDSLNNVLPARNSSSLNDSVNSINGKVVLVKVNGTIKNVTFSFAVLNETLGNPQCVFWNFSLFGGLGGWDDNGCELQSDEDRTVTCHCNHLTSYSILMSPFIPDAFRAALDFITYIGVGISMGCLVVCLIIEILVWNAVTGNNTSYMRHVSIVNIALSLLIADIWFIIGAAISEYDQKNVPACSAATFFIHFFYLALFFWMLVSGLLLLYRTVMVFSHMSKPAMLAFSFFLGYGAPIIIAVITIAVTAPVKEYIRDNDGVCWLNWTESMALLAFVIPALTIVVINLLILIVVLYKMLTRGVGDVTQPDERNAVVVIARCLAILTPFFGTTWGLGVGTMTNPENLGIHIVFAIFNSLQGLFILVFGTLLDKKIREALTGMSQVSSNRTRTTNATTSSTSGLGFFRIRRRNIFNISAAPTYSTTGASETFINT